MGRRVNGQLGAPSQFGAPETRTFRVLGTRYATTVTVVFVVVTWFVQLLGPLLNLPDFVRQLALTSHYGQTMVGVWDSVGIVASLVLVVAGAAIGAWGFARRDLRA